MYRLESGLPNLPFDLYTTKTHFPHTLPTNPIFVPNSINKIKFPRNFRVYLLADRCESVRTLLQEGRMGDRTGAVTPLPGRPAHTRLRRTLPAEGCTARQAPKTGEGCTPQAYPSQEHGRSRQASSRFPDP